MLISKPIRDVALIKIKIGALEEARTICTDIKVKMAIKFWIAAERRKLTSYNSE